MSFHPKTRYGYLPAQETVARLQAQKDPLLLPTKSVANLGVEVPDLPEDLKVEEQIRQAWKGRLIAWDPVNKRPAWNVEYAAAGSGGALATAGNLVFQGTAPMAELSPAARTRATSSGKRV